MKIGIDCDGVIANFNEAYMDLIVATTGKDLFLPKPYLIQTWAYPEALGYTRKEVSRVWDVIKKDENFWFLLPSLPGAEDFLIDLATLDAEVYFITSRVGVNVKRQSEYWLMARGYILPTVLITPQKGDACRILSLDFYIDDKVENCKDVFDRSLFTRGYMLAQPWNEQVEGVPRIDSLNEFLEMVKSGGRNE